MRPIIKVENLSKSYHIGARQESYGTLSERIAAMIRAPLKGFSLNGKSTPEIISALKDVSFEVERGETVGIIGRNGAGKSTLLKVLSRITEPTSGRALLWGRIASLLEVGTGFHPELTGRENVYLNGAILGMSRNEIQQRFDEIVAFAEIDKFIDTPVKRYSSGMYVRLAFAVAAHLEPEILVIDEVLSVGDAAFQKKCLGKIGDVATHGRTVVFVSHNMAAIENLCSRCIVLSNGQVTFDGDTMKGIGTYFRSIDDPTVSLDLEHYKERNGDGRMIITSFSLRDSEGHHIEQASCGHQVTLVFRYKVKGELPLNKVVPSFAIRTIYGSSIILHRSNFTGQIFDGVADSGEFWFRLPRLPLTANTYEIDGNIEVGGEVADDLTLGKLQVIEGDYFGTGSAGIPNHSPVLVDGVWGCTPGSRNDE